MNKLFKSSIGLVTAATLLSAVAPTIASADQLTNNGKSSPSINASDAIKDTPSSEFIQKFDNCIELSNNKFVINYSKLPKNSTSDELKQLKNLIEEKNSLISNSENRTGTKVSVDNNSVTLMSQESSVVSDTLNDSMLKFKEVKNYVHVYWWGLRIGISKSVLATAVSVGCVIGGVYIEAKIIQVLLGLLGISVSSIIPGGIVFNTTPGIANVWGVEFQ